MSKFIYKGTLNEKYIAGTILSDNIEANKISVNTLDSTREDINVLKNVNIDGDLSVSGDINIEDVDIETINTKTINAKNGNNIIKIYDNQIQISKDNGTNWRGLISAGTGKNAVILNNFSTNTSSGDDSLAEGSNTTASGNQSHAEGFKTTASGNFSHTEGRETTAIGLYSHAEGFKSTASGEYSHCEGGYASITQHYCTSSGLGSHAEGCGTTADHEGAHAEGYETYALNNEAHAEGCYTKATGEQSHAEGKGQRINTTITYLIASGNQSHAEGNLTTASGNQSHAEGNQTTASATASHSGGDHTISNTIAGTAIGKYNISGSNKLFVVGNGTDDNNRSDAFVVYTDGNITLNNTLFKSGTGHSQFLTYAQQDYANNDNDTRAISNDDFSYYILGNLITINIPLRDGYKFVSAYRSRNDLANDFIDYYIINLDFSSIKSFLDTYYNATTSRFCSCCNSTIITTIPDVSHCLKCEVSSYAYGNCYSNGISIILESQGPASGNKSTDPFKYYIEDFDGFGSNQILTCTISYVKLT